MLWQIVFSFFVQQLFENLLQVVSKATNRESDIYDWSIKEAPIVNAYTGDIFKFKDPHSGADIVVGTDKVGHFFAQGLDLYEKKREGITTLLKRHPTANWDDIRNTNNKENIAALNQSWWWEDGIYGLGNGRPIPATNVFSYADLAANYDGLTFWYVNTCETHLLYFVQLIV